MKEMKDDTSHTKQQNLEIRYIVPKNASKAEHYALN